MVDEIASVSQLFHSTDSTGHDWWHVYRVWNMAKHIAQVEEANMLIVELAALLHDMDDHKISKNDVSDFPNARQALNSVDADEQLVKKVLQVISEVSFKGANVETTPTTIEACVVQDADRLDAIGAIGIARAFAYGGSKNRPLYDPNQKPLLHTSFDEYKKSNGNTVNHFYEKLLLLKDRMNTPTAKEIAASRHLVMEEYLKQFFTEWNCFDNIK